MSDELREIVEAARRSHSETHWGGQDWYDDESRRTFERTFNPERVSKMLDVIEAAQAVKANEEKAAAYIEERPESGGSIGIAMEARSLWLELLAALAALDASSSVTEGRTG